MRGQAWRSGVWAPPTFGLRTHLLHRTPDCSCNAAPPRGPAPPRASCSAPAYVPARVRALLARDWLLERPDTQVTHVGGTGGSGGGCGGGAAAGGFWLVRDDLLHPVAGGNKLRKLDALLPQLRAAGATDIVTCGGLQSAHTAAVAALCAEQGLRAYLLVRGERPAVPTGLHLYARMYGHVTYVPRSEYADRDTMFETHAARVGAEAGGGAQVAVIREGGADPAALLGLLRLAEFLARESQLGRQLPCNFVVDCGTGVTATGLALAALLLDLPWRVTGIMMAADLEYYQGQAESLLAAFKEQYGPQLGSEHSLEGQCGTQLGNERSPAPEQYGTELGSGRSPASERPPRAVHEGGARLESHRLRLEWVQRSTPRKFGKVLPGELAACAAIAREHGVLLDPMWTLASWQTAQQLVDQAAAQRQRTQSDGAAHAPRREGDRGERVVVLMTGGGLGLHGLAQRWPNDF